MRNRIQHYVRYGWLVLWFSLTAIQLVNADDLQPPQAVIQTVSDTLQKKLQDKSFSQDFVQVTQFVSNVIDPHTDFDKISLLVLGKHWKTASPDEQARFKQEFQTLIVRAYARAFIEYSNWKINYLPAEISADGIKALVKTKVLQPSIQPIDVNYRMFLHQGEWKVYDILIDGMSLVTNYRSTFDSEIQNKGSLTAVIDTLTQRNAEALAKK